MDNPFEALQKQLNQLQHMVGQLLAKPDVAQPSTELPIAFDAACRILMMSESAAYQNMSKIPHYKRHGKLYFFESELLDYIRNKSTSTTIDGKPARSRRQAVT
ncbi:helix-turn-helix domain-containing protein [Spirosoma sp. RP8]|uniref:Helix-turn-helix domain-containing protein n=1 Tax=Spirosoma liriopis TaxID=2937440 RepID=A0ABT0HN15_9BACT|nr:helix-turn-helix domain-containing protein [Spirosoma liriopis]MCK8493558.1 helix-turn-helix domain-containing protein [Spirosoma liriopis]